MIELFSSVIAFSLVSSEKKKMESFRKAYGALKDSTTVSLAKVNSDFKDLDIAIVKATNHVESPPKGRHVRKIFLATSSQRPRADVAYCIYALSRRLEKTRNWIVAIKTLIVIHRTLREGDPTFRDELLNYSARDHIFQISNFKDDSSPLAWECSAWVRTYAMFLEERLSCFRTLKYDIESERMTKMSSDGSKVHHRTRLLSSVDLLEQLPSLQRLLYSLIGCQPEGAASHNFLIQYALALVLKESFKIYCAINDGIINLVDLFFDMAKHDAIKALDIYRRAGQQAEGLANFYGFCRVLDLARTFQFPILKQPPPSFLATMEEYIKEAPQLGSVSNRRLEYREAEPEPEEPVEPTPEETEKLVGDPEPEQVDIHEEPEPEPEPEKVEDVHVPALISTDESADLLGLNEINPRAQEIEDSNALALAIKQPGNDDSSNGFQLMEFGKTSGWELALVTAPSNNNNKSHVADRKMAGGFDNLLLDSLYEDEAARRQLQLQNAGYGSTSGYEMPGAPNPFEQQQHDPFAMSNNIAPPANVQMALMAQQQQQQYMTMQQQSYHNNSNMMVPHQFSAQYSQPNMMNTGASNPFGDPFNYPQSAMPPQGNHTLI